MVGVTLRTLMRMTQRRQFGGPNIADKATKGMPGFDAESIKHNYSVGIGHVALSFIQRKDGDC